MADDAVERSRGKFNSRGEPKLSAQVRQPVTWPTPSASLHNDGEAPETWLARADQLKAKHGNGNGAGMPLAVAAKLWPTPSAGMHKQDVNDAGQYAEGILADGHQIMLPAAVKLWPTPRSTDGEHGGRVTPRKSREGGNLIEAVSARNFPTPSSRDWKGGASAESLEARGKSPDNTLPDAVERDVAGQLNPDWVELLMGWPLGWTRLDPLDPAVFEAWRAAFLSGEAVVAWQDGTWEEGVPRVAVKTPHRVPRLTGLGNGQVPLVVAVAWRTLEGA